jgi:carbamoyl-phosphate synthase large subunit
MVGRDADRNERPTDATTIVTGAGGAAGVAVIRELVARGVDVVAADADERAVGLALGSRRATLPRCDAPDFVDRVCEVAFEHGAQALISTVTEEMATLGRRAELIADAGLATWLAPPAAIEACRDKWRFAELLRDTAISAPATALGMADGLPGPWIVKPRFGRGSRAVVSADSRADLAWAIAHVPEPIVQTRLSGREFTVDCLIDRDGTLAAAVPRWRIETKAGISTKGETFDSAVVVSGVQALVREVGLEGAANVQGFVAADGAVAFVEINPRFSGALPLSLAAGADLVGEYVRVLTGHPLRPERLTYRAGVRMARYYEEIFAG